MIYANSSDTIYATATAPGKAAISVLRISGEKTASTLQKLLGRLPKERLATVCKIRSPETKEVLDEALVIYFGQGRSYTGEESAELHLHGGRAITIAVSTCLERAKVRMAEPGEFTFRALRNNRMDISQIEGLGDLIDAKTEKQRRQAMRSFEGIISKKTKQWRNDLIRCLSLVETEIEFTDEDIPLDIKQKATKLLKKFHHQLDDQVSGVALAERLREGFEVAIVGPPNSGKSTLLNYLARRDAAITSNIPGTTRDVIEVQMDLGGIPVNFLDTAGLRETSDPIEKLGITQTIKRANAADLRIFLLGKKKSKIKGVKFKKGDLQLIAKADLLKNNSDKGVSGKTGQGVDHLLQSIAEQFDDKIQRVGVAVNTRHKIAMENTMECLQKAICELQKSKGVDEIAAEEIRGAVRSLETITGRIDIENVLGDIFSNFCIGK